MDGLSVAPSLAPLPPGDPGMTSAPLSWSPERPAGAGRSEEGARGTRGTAYLTFLARERACGLALPYARGIEPLGPLTPLPHAPPWVLGLVNLRGPIVAAVDLGAFLALEPAGGPPRSLVVGRLGDVHVALAVQAVLGLRTFPPEAIHPAGRVGGAVNAFLVGLVQDGAHLVALLDAQRLLLGPELQVRES